MKLMKLMKLSPPPVAIIILNWNGLSDTLECLESVFKNNYQNYSVYVVDNASEGDANLRMACESTNRTKHPLIFIQNKTNLGFAEGNNVGIRRAMQDGAEYIFTLNNDTVVDPGFLTEAMASFLCNSVDNEIPRLQPALSKSASADESNGLGTTRGIGIVATTMLSYYDHTRIDSLGHDLLTSGDSIPRGRGELYSAFPSLLKANEANAANEASPLGACAGAALYSVEMLRQIGLFDADFFLNYEDADLSLRAIVQGWRVVHCPTSIIYHKGNVSIKKIKDTKYRIRSQRNMLWAYFHNIPLPVLLLNLPWMIIRDFLAIVFSALALQFSITKIFILSRWQVFQSLTTIIRKRRLVLSHERISNWWLWRNQRSWIPLYIRYLIDILSSKIM